MLYNIVHYIIHNITPPVSQIFNLKADISKSSFGFVIKTIIYRNSSMSQAEIEIYKSYMTYTDFLTFT